MKLEVHPQVDAALDRYSRNSYNAGYNGTLQRQYDNEAILKWALTVQIQNPWRDIQDLEAELAETRLDLLDVVCEAASEHDCYDRYGFEPFAPRLSDQEILDAVRTGRKQTK